MPTDTTKNTDAADVSTEERIRAAIAADPAWTPTGRGETRVVNRMIDDGEATATWGQRGVFTSVTLTGAKLSPEVIADNFLNNRKVVAAKATFLRAVRDDVVTLAHIRAALGVKPEKAAK